MKIGASIVPHTLRFTFDAKTSRGSLGYQKPTWFLVLTDKDSNNVGIGECSPLQGLSPELQEDADYVELLKWFCGNIENNGVENTLQNTSLKKLPSLRFGLEVAFKDLLAKGSKSIFESSFTEGEPIPINGLIWIADKKRMAAQIENKLGQDFNCIKLKVGTLNFEEEITLIRQMREQFDSNTLTIRVDANGAFSPTEALEKLKRLAELEVHSIEQPIAPNQYEEMAMLCEFSPMPIALDEELIQVFGFDEKQEMLSKINPPYIILKPSLHGGFNGTEEWINLAEEKGIGWWLTSALESNIGLNAICQFAAFKQAKGHQGLGTGQLYHNNIPSPLSVANGYIRYDKSKKWDTSQIL